MKNHLCYCCLCKKFSIVARTMAEMRHFKAWFPAFQGFSDEFLHGTNYFIKVKKIPSTENKHYISFQYVFICMAQKIKRRCFTRI